MNKTHSQFYKCELVLFLFSIPLESEIKNFILKERRTRGIHTYREAFPSKAYNDFYHFVNVRRKFFLTMVTSYWNELTNSSVNAININSFKLVFDSLPILAAKAILAVVCLTNVN